MFHFSYVSLSISIKWQCCDSGLGKKDVAGCGSAGFMDGAARVRNRKALMGVGMGWGSLLWWRKTLMDTCDG